MVLRLWYAPRRKFFDTLADDRLVKYTPLPQRGSTNGGARRSGAATGKKLFYIALDGRLMAVAIRIASTPQTIDAVSPVPLFATRVGEAFILSLQPAVRRLSRLPEVPDEPRQSSRISGRLVLPFGTPSSRCLATLSQARSRRFWRSTGFWRSTERIFRS